MKITKTFSRLEKIQVDLTPACIHTVLMDSGRIPEGFSLVDSETNDGSVRLYLQKDLPDSASGDSNG